MLSPRGQSAESECTSWRAGKLAGFSSKAALPTHVRSEAAAGSAPRRIVVTVVCTVNVSGWLRLPPNHGAQAKEHRDRLGGLWVVGSPYLTSKGQSPRRSSAARALLRSLPMLRSATPGKTPICTTAVVYAGRRMFGEVSLVHRGM